DREVVYTRGEESEVSAVQNGEVAQCDVPAQLERDGLIGSALAAREASAVDAAWSGDGGVLDAFAPDEAVVKVAVSVVLEFVPLVGLGGVVGGGVRGGFECRAGREVESDVAAEVNGAGDPRAGGDLDGAATGCCGGFDGAVDG